MKPTECVQLLAVVKSYWHQYAPSRADVEAATMAYADALFDVPYAAGERAVRDLGKEARPFAPTAGEIRQRAVALSGPACPVCGERGSHVHDVAPRIRRPALPPAPAALSGGEASE